MESRRSYHFLYWVLLLALAGVSTQSWGSSGGITGRSTAGCAAAGCHGYNATPTFVGPYRYTGTLYGNASGSWSTGTQTLDNYTESLSVLFFLNKDSGSNGVRFGLDVSATGGTLSDTSSALDTVSGEVVHNTPHSTACVAGGPAGCSTASGDRQFSFISWAPPLFTSGDFTINACGNVVDGDGLADAGDNDSTGGLCDSMSVAVRPYILNWSGTYPYTEGDGYIVIDSTVTQYATDLRLARVTLTNPQTNDILACPSSSTTGITCTDYGSYVQFTPTSGTTYPESSFELAIQGVRFANFDNDINTTTRTVELYSYDADFNYSLTQTKNISITAVNDAPSLTSLSASSSYTENAAAVTLDSALTITDLDDTQLNRAEVQITGSFQSGQDVLAASYCPLSCSYSSVTGQLTISGTSTLAVYEQILESVTYVNTSDDPSTSTRTITFRVRDTGNLYGTDDSMLMYVYAQNDAPVISNVNSSLFYTEGDGAQLIDTSITVSDVDSAQITSATVTISAGYASGEDSLAAPTCGANGLSCSFNSGVLTISGNASTAVYESVLEAVTYSNSSQDPSTATRTLSYVVRDTSLAFSVADTTSVFVSRANDAPVITEGASTNVNMSEDGSPTPFSLTLNATDVDSSDTLTWSISSQASNGIASASGTGTSKVISYTPEQDYNGADAFVVQVSDGTTTDTITVNVSLTAQNDAPVITQGASTSVIMSEDGSPTPFSLILNATDVEGSSISWSISSQASNGTASASGTGTSKAISYTPAANYNGADAFVVQVSDGVLTDTITVNVTVNAVNDAPVITEGASTNVAMSEDSSPTPFSLTLNATDIDVGDTLTWSISAQGSNGTASASGTGTSKVIGYTPNANYNGSDSFTVQVSDGTTVDTILVSVTISAQNDAPVITQGASTNVLMSEDGSPTPFSLTLNATDVEGSSISWSISSQASNGTATASGTGTSKAIGYTPVANFSGADSFVVQVSDGLLTDTITVNVTVTAVDDSPVITEGVSVNVNMSEDGSPTPFSLTLNATDLDTGAGSLTWSISTPASNGSAAASGTGASKAISYTPNSNYNGADNFVVSVSDGSTSDTILVNVNISAQNDAPVITEGASTDVIMSEDGSPTPFALTLNATDAENSTLTWTVLTQATQGVAAASGTGNSKVISYTPVSHFNGADSFVIRVSDGQLTDTITVNVTVQAVNDLPVITDGASVNVDMSEDGSPTPFSLTLNATDLEGGTLTWSISSQGSNGTASASGTGTSKAIGYTPNANFSGADSFVVTVSDGEDEDSITVNVNVVAQNDAPVITEGASVNVNMSEDSSPTPFSLTLNVTDIDTAAGALTWSISSQASQGTASASGTGTSKAISYTPSANYNGADSFVVQVSDGSAADTIIVNVSIAAINDSPVISSTAPTSATESELYNYTISVSDPDDAGFDSNLFLSLNTAPAGMSLNTATGVLTWTPPNGGPSPVDVEIQVADGGENGAVVGTQSWQISVDNVNDPPVIVTTAPTTATEDQLYTYAVGVTDPDDTNNGANLTWQLFNAPAGMVVSSTGVITWTPGEGVLTSGTVTVQVADGGESGALPDTEAFTITVTPRNDAPQISALPSANAIEDTTYSFFVTVSDPDDSSWTFSLSGAPAGMAIDPSTGEITWTPGEGVLTSGSVTVTVADGGEDSAAPDMESFTIAVTPVNDAPLITSSAVTTATEGQLYQYTVTVSDPDDANNGSALVFSLPIKPAGMSISSTGLIQWTPANGVTSANVQVQVADGGENGAAAATQNFSITVTGVNDAPTITSVAETSALEDTLYQYQLTVLDPDDNNNGTDLAYSFITSPSGMTVSSTGLIEWTPAEGVTTADVEVQVADGGENGAAPDSQAYTITVISVNDAPQITSTAPTTASEDVQYSYQLVVDDPDDANNGVALSYSLGNAPAGMTVSSTGLVTWTPAEGVTTSGSVTVTVQDGGEDGALPDSEVFTVAVSAVNDAPVITAVPFADAVEDTLYTFTVTVSDPDDSSWSFALQNAPAGMTINSSTGQISWTPTEGVLSSGTVTVTAADGGENGVLPASQDFSIAVIAVNDEPVITALPSSNAVEDTAYSFTVLVSDPDDSSWLFSLNNAPAGMSIDPSSGEITWTPGQAFVATGSGVVTVNVADGGEDGAQPASQTFSIGVTAVNDPPTITAVPFADAVEDVPYAFTVTVTDPDDSSWTFSLLNAPAGMLIDAASGEITWTPTEGVLSSGTVTVVVADGGEDGAAPDTADFSIAVAPVNDAPVITALPSANAVEDTLYSFTVLVTDPDDSSWTFSLQNAPAGMTINASSGEITWTPAEGVLTSGSVTVMAADGGEDGASPDSEVFTIAVTPVNDAPVIIAFPQAAATEDTLYSFDVQVSDPDDSSWNFGLQNAPAGMSIDANGQITWTPGEGVTTSGNVTLTAADGGEDGAAAAVQVFSIAVTAVNDAPIISSAAITSATEDVLYQYQVVVSDPDDLNNGVDLTYVFDDAPDGMLVSSTGLIQWTPLEGVTAANVTVRVNDGGENSAAAATQTFAITVTSVNDAPTLEPVALQTVQELSDLSVQLQVTDPDDDASGLSWSLISPPAGMTISTSGLVEWTPGQSTAGDYVITAQVADGGEDGAAPGQVSFDLTVTILDSDGDSVADYSDNCPAVENTNQANFDGDSDGDACDDDDDNDGITDVAEIANGLDPLDPSDASGDVDGDGDTNLDEFLICVGGGDASCLAISTDTVAPEITLSDVYVDSDGMATSVDLNATASDVVDGVVPVRVVEIDGVAVDLEAGARYRFRTGSHEVLWRAVDTSGNIAEQVQMVRVVPQVLLSGSKVAGEGQTVQVEFHLNGPALSYPLTLHYSFMGSADGSDYVDANAGQIDLVSGESVTLDIDLVADALVEGDEVLQISLDTVDGEAFVGLEDMFTVQIVETQVAPEVSLHAEQGGLPGTLLYSNEGVVTIIASGTDANGDALIFDWSAPSLALTCLIDMCSFDPSGLSGDFQVTVTVSDGTTPVQQSLFVQVQSGNAPLLSDLDDQDADGIDDLAEGHGDADGDGIPDYLDVVAQPFLQQPGAVDSGFDVSDLLQTGSGIQIVIGADALANGAAGTSVLPGLLPRDIEYAELGAIHDLALHGLSAQQRTAWLVVPLAQPITPDSWYRRLVGDSWYMFNYDASNWLRSANRVDGVCPSMLDSSWTNGLGAGDDCLMISITDGGPNDADGLANGVILLEGGVAIIREVETDTSIPSDKANSGSLGWWWLIGLALLVLRGRRECGSKR